MRFAKRGDYYVDALKHPGKSDMYQCPRCRNQVIYRNCSGLDVEYELDGKMFKRKGSVNHFYHAVGSDCSHGVASSGESQEHLDAKYALLSYITSMECFSNVDIERRTDSGAIPDLMCEFKGSRVAFEIQKSSLSTKSIISRTQRLSDDGFHVIWLPIKHGFKLINAISEVSLGFFIRTSLKKLEKGAILFSHRYEVDDSIDVPGYIHEMDPIISDTGMRILCHPDAISNRRKHSEYIESVRKKEIESSAVSVYTGDEDVLPIEVCLPGAKKSSNSTDFSVVDPEPCWTIDYLSGKNRNEISFRQTSFDFSKHDENDAACTVGNDVNRCDSEFFKVAYGIEHAELKAMRSSRDLSRVISKTPDSDHDVSIISNMLDSLVMSMMIYPYMCNEDL